MAAKTNDAVHLMVAEMIFLPRSSNSFRLSTSSNSSLVLNRCERVLYMSTPTWTTHDAATPRKWAVWPKTPHGDKRGINLETSKELMAMETPQDERLTSESCPCNSAEIDGFWHSPFCLSCRWFGSICRWIDICKLLDKANTIFFSSFPFFLDVSFSFFLFSWGGGGYLCYLDSLLQLKLFISDIQHWIWSLWFMNTWCFILNHVTWTLHSNPNHSYVTFDTPKRIRLYEYLTLHSQLKTKCSENANSNDNTMPNTWFLNMGMFESK